MPTLGMSRKACPFPRMVVSHEQEAIGDNELTLGIFRMDQTEVKEMTVIITPLHDRVLVRRLEEKETGGVFNDALFITRRFPNSILTIGKKKQIPSGRRWHAHQNRSRRSRTENERLSRSSASPKRLCRHFHPIFSAASPLRDCDDWLHHRQNSRRSDPVLRRRCGLGLNFRAVISKNGKVKLQVANRDGCLFRLRPPSLPSTSRFRHRICSFIWSEIAKEVFTTEDWSVFSARILAHKSAAEIGRADF